MATIETRRNKSGDITSYRIVVCAGYDSKGTKILRRKTWKPDPQKTQRQNEKALQKAAAFPCSNWRIISTKPGRSIVTPEMPSSRK